MAFQSSTGSALEGAARLKQPQTRSPTSFGNRVIASPPSQRTNRDRDEVGIPSAARVRPTVGLVPLASRQDVTPLLRRGQQKTAGLPLSFRCRVSSPLQAERTVENGHEVNPVECG